MSLHHTTIDWQRTPHATGAATYSRNHLATLNGGQAVVVSASSEYKGDPDCADPEQLLLTALASCHMLTFLAIAEFQGYHVECYRDNPIAHLEKNAEGRMAVTRIELSPQVCFDGDKQPDDAALAKLHDGAHRNCFIAHSITARVTVSAAMATSC
ncbi:OsmC family protein [Polaromonas sp. P1(28)-13]|nr:OsmC family protein [Polaromonas sp. P1(28)-13]